MEPEVAAIEEERARKLKELFFLLSNPLQPLSEFGKTLQSPVARQFFRANDISIGGRLLTRALPHTQDQDTLKTELERVVQAELSGTKRRYDRWGTYPSKAQKTVLTQYPSRLMPARADEHRKPSRVRTSSPVDVLERKTNEFLNKNISDLDVLSVPEHYPTEVHNVSSLAELYYLTQTLPLIKLLPGSHKTLMTEDFELALLEGKIAVLYSRIEELKRQKKWSLRQPMRYYDPFLYTKRNKKTRIYQWDMLLEEARWMAADFKESSKFKKACCIAMAQAVQDYWSYGKIMCVKRKPIRHLGEVEEGDKLMDEASDLFKDAVEDIPATAQGESESVLDEMVLDIPEQENDDDEGKSDAKQESEKAENDQNKEIQFKSESEINADVAAIQEPPEPETIDISKLLERPDPKTEIIPPDLPQYSVLPKDAVPSPFKLYVNFNDLKKIDQSIIRNLPVFTAFDEPSAQNPLKPSETSIVPVSRMLHPHDADDSWHKIIVRDAERVFEADKEPPALQEGVFGLPLLRRFNYLKPPKPPLIKNIEYRAPTIWLPQDDRHLIHYVAEYCFNWELIAAHLLAHSATLKRYESNIERRTPWLCFERYIQLNDKFQFTDMKGPNAYAAQEWLEHAHKAQQTLKRRISPLGVGNESIQRGHRRLRWASMFDAMRKAIRKRETAAAKATARRPEFILSSSSSSFSSMSNGSNVAGTGAAATNGKRPADRVPTPAELAKLKFERDKTIHDAYVNQQATRSRMAAAVKLPATDSRLPPSKLALSSIKRPTTPNGTPYTVEQIQQLLQMQKQRRLMQSQGNPAKKMMGTGPGFLTTSGSPQMAATSSLSVASATVGASAGNAAVGSSVKRVPPKGRLQFAPGQVLAIISLIQQKNPKLTKEQVTKLAASYLANLQEQQQNRLEQQQQQQQQQQQLQQLQRQMRREDTPSLSKLQYEERKKLMMQGVLPYLGTLSPNYSPEMSPNASSRRRGNNEGK